MFGIKKMYKGRNPSPPDDVDFNYRSNAHELEKTITRFIAMKTNTAFPNLDYFREALEKSVKVKRDLREKNQDVDPCSESHEVVPQSICNNRENRLTNYSSEENSKQKDVLNELKSLRMSEDFKTLPYLKPNSDENREDDLEATFHGNKVHEINDNIFNHSSGCLEKNSSDDSSRSKIQERRRNSTEHRKHQKRSHREKKKDIKPRTYKDQLEEYEYISKKYRSKKRSAHSKSYRRKHRSSSRSSNDDSDSSYERQRSYGKVSRRKHRDTYSSDDSPEHSPRNRSYRRDGRRRSKERSRSRDRVSRKKHRESSYSSDNSSEYSNENRSCKREERRNSKENALLSSSVGVKPALPRDTHSDSNASVKASPKRQQELVSEDTSGLSVEDFKNVSQSVKASQVKREEKPDSPPPKPLPNQFKLSPRSDEESSTGAFNSSSSHYCKVCQKTLNGITCYETHMNGKKHKKAAEKAQLRSKSLTFDQEVGKHTKEPSVKKELLTPIKDDMYQSFETALYQEKIDAHRKDPIQGLEFVDEIHNHDGTISYRCNLCEAPCAQTSIFSHLVGFKHSMRYLKKIDPGYYEQIKNKPKGEVVKRVKDILQDHEKKHGRKLIKVKIPIPSSSDAADGLDPIGEELNAADYLDPSGNYYCKICNAYMNNENMWHSHMVGKRHLKNVKKTSSGLVPSMPIPSSKKEKVPNARSRLEAELENYYEFPIVGLNFIREIQSVNGVSYMCFICNSSASKDILDHIISMKHQIKYLETVDTNNSIPNGIQYIRELDVSDQARSELVQEECRKVEDDYGRGRVEVYR